MMQQFTGFEYLLIDLANHFGLDKLTFDPRIEWAMEHLANIEFLVDAAKPKTRPLFFKTCLSIRRAQAKQPIGHLVGFDAICSGIQVMSALTGCATGLKNTGLIGDSVREDAYQTCTNHMSEELGGFSIERDLAKDALMKMMYGSQREPEEIFGKDTPELSAFYIAAEKTAPGAYQLLQELLGAWQAFAPVHQWTLPDGFLARVRVREKVTCRPSIDELNGASFTYVYKEYMGTETGISLPANVTHSVDAYVLRCVQRRCNYDKAQLDRVFSSVADELMARDGGFTKSDTAIISDKLAYYIHLYEQTKIADIVIMPYLNGMNVCGLETEHLRALHSIMVMMGQHKPFPIVTVHDEFKCHPNNMNYLRLHYREVFAQLAESNLLQSIMNELTNNPKGVYKKRDKNLGQLIRQSNYGIC